MTGRLGPSPSLGDLRRRRRTGVVRAAVAALAAGGLAGCSASVTGDRPQGSTTTTSLATVKHIHTPPPNPWMYHVPRRRPGPIPSPQHPAPAAPAAPGALGDRVSWEACNLLTRAQIAAQFGGPVGPPTPTYPDCSWLVGRNAFLALDIEPRTSFTSATQYVAALEHISNVGTRAIIGNNRYLYFSNGTTSYWLLWQRVGDFSSLDTTHLVTLANEALSATARRQPSQPPPTVVPTLRDPPNPVVYFAGDSTAAGPEWAWATYFATKATPTLSEYQVGSDLEVPGYFDWTHHLRAVALARKPKLVVYMGSANDGQPIFYKGAFRSPGSAGWKVAYGALVGTLMRGVASTGTRLLVIGEPAMQDPSLSSAMAAMNEVDAAQARLYKGVYFFDPGTVLNGPQGHYEPTIVIDGKATPVRLDGIHLDIAGSVYLARYIAKLIEKLLPKPSPATPKSGHLPDVG